MTPFQLSEFNLAIIATIELLAGIVAIGLSVLVVLLIVAVVFGFVRALFWRVQGRCHFCGSSPLRHE